MRDMSKSSSNCRMICPTTPSITWIKSAPMSGSVLISLTSDSPISGLGGRNDVLAVHAARNFVALVEKVTKVLQLSAHLPVLFVLDALSLPLPPF